MTRAAHLVSAGAGSGKTYWIVERLVERIVAGEALERVAAVTFTEAAAAELQDRVRARLLSTEHAPLAARVDSAAICTIHRFALALLSRYPLAAGLPPQPVVLDEGQRSLLLARSLAEVLREDVFPDLAELLVESLGPGLGLIERGRTDADSPAGRLRALAEAAIEKARSLGMDSGALEREGDAAVLRVRSALGPVGAAAKLEANLEAALKDAITFVRENPEPPAAKDQQLYRLVRAASAQRDSGAPWHDRAAVRLASVADDAASKKFKPGSALIAAAGAYASEHPRIRVRVEAGARGVVLAAARALAAFEREKRRVGAVDFEDMQVLALELLAGRGPTAQPYAPLVAATFRYVIVDEFQDSSPLQFALFEALRAHGSEVVYVGDVKQGIYGFRSADSRLFSALLAEARDAGAAPSRLGASRRSRPELVEFANDLFGAAMPSRGIEYEALGVENAYARGECPKTLPSIDVVRHPNAPRGPTRGAREAATIARLQSLITGGGLEVIDRATERARPARWGDVAILARTNIALSTWARHLRARGIPAALSQGDLFETLEVRLCVAWLRMLASPRDSAAAAGVLLSELYGISQATMTRMALAGLLGSPRRALDLAASDPAAWPLSSHERRALTRCAADLSAGRRALRHLPLPEAVETVIERVDLALRLSTHFPPDRAVQARANIRRIAAAAHALAARTERPLSLGGATGITLENLLLVLERDAAAHVREHADEDGDDAVRLVTIHGAKGLEYPIVVLDALGEDVKLRLPRIEIERPADRAELLGPDALVRSGLRVLPDVGPGILWERLARAFDHEQSERQEWLRLLYVAITRAREHLVLLWPEDPKTASSVRRVKDIIIDAVESPPVAGGEGGWCLRAGAASHRVNVFHATVGDALDEPAMPTPADDPAWAALRALADAEPAEVEQTATLPRLRLGVVAPTDLCRVADCPEVPRLAVLYPAEHHLARRAGVPITHRRLPSARAERDALGGEIEPSSLGLLLHQAIERADLFADVDAPDPNVDRLLARQGHPSGLVASFIRAAVRTARAAVRALEATEIVARECPFALDVEGTLMRGAIDLVLRAPNGLHVVDYKAHAVEGEALARWAGFYGPQLDAYALAIARLTGERIAGRHLLLPSSGLLASLVGDFDADAATRAVLSYCATLVAETPGPGAGNDCAVCDWRTLCRIGQSNAD